MVDPKLQKEEVKRRVKAKDLPAVHAAISFLAGSEVPVATSRQALLSLCEAAEELDNDGLKEVASAVVDAVQRRPSTFDDVARKAREQVAEVQAAEDDYTAAARTLAAINLESASDPLSDADRANLLVRISELFLQDNESVDAEIFLNRAHQYLAGTDWVLQMRYNVSTARILDAKRKFAEAALKYYTLSQSASSIDDEDADRLLASAVTCAVLAKAGPQRSRILGLLYKDERVRSARFFGVLEKMYKDRLLSMDEVSAFESSLLPHQSALLADGTTVVRRAVTEHNVQAASRVFRNITSVHLARLLGVGRAEAEKAVARMAQEGRIQGSVCQRTGVITFETRTHTADQWDARIARVCAAASQCADAAEKAMDGAGVGVA